MHLFVLVQFFSFSIYCVHVQIFISLLFCVEGMYADAADAEIAGNAPLSSKYQSGAALKHRNASNMGKSCVIDCTNGFINKMIEV